mmetsp:Transcript_26358/g.42571  ORF Transcript_26358/g.42571 Transcript_26358/m.42571 type:complete len:423 (+) Transcript_26358:229-1497(+)
MKEYLIRNKLADDHDDEDGDTIMSPCAFKGFNESYHPLSSLPSSVSASASTLHFVGRGNFEECFQIVFSCMGSSISSSSSSSSRHIMDSSQDSSSSIMDNQDNKGGDWKVLRRNIRAQVENGGHFIGLSMLFHLTHFLSIVYPHSMSTFPNPTLAEIKSHSRKLCQTDWNELKEMYQGKDPYTPKGMMKGRCFDAALVVSLLQNFGFSEDERVFTFIVERNGIEADWTYGAALTILLQGKEEEEEEDRSKGDVWPRGVAISLVVLRLLQKLTKRSPLHARTLVKLKSLELLERFVNVSEPYVSRFALKLVKSCFSHAPRAWRSQKYELMTRIYSELRMDLMDTWHVPIEFEGRLSKEQRKDEEAWRDAQLYNLKRRRETAFERVAKRFPVPKIVEEETGHKDAVVVMDVDSYIKMLFETIGK